MNYVAIQEVNAYLASNTGYNVGKDAPVVAVMAQAAEDSANAFLGVNPNLTSYSLTVPPNRHALVTPLVNASSLQATAVEGIAKNVLILAAQPIGSSVPVNVSVTGGCGPTNAPAFIKLAILEAVAHCWGKRERSLATTGAQDAQALPYEPFKDMDKFLSQRLRPHRTNILRIE